MNYKAGDRVVIKPWGLMVEQYGFGWFGDININNKKTCFLASMEDWFKGKDRIVTIFSVNKARSEYKIEENERFDADEMILGYAFEYGEEIEVSYDSSTWFKDIFCNYGLWGLSNKDSAVKCCCSRDTYGFFRPIRKHIINIDGKDVEISSETYDDLKKHFNE